jgi:Uma2 family endonuclease
MVMTAAGARSTRPARRYLREPERLVFPVEEEVPEGGVHVRLRTLLWQLIRAELGHVAMVGSDQFVFWDASDPRRRLAPDVWFWRGAPDAPVQSWKVWERGAPHVAVEILSPEEGESARGFGAKLARYRQCGVREVVMFDAEDFVVPLRLWDRVEEDLVERDLGSPEALLSDALGLYWCVRPDPQLGQVLRLARDAAGSDLIPTFEEALAAEREALAAEREALAAEKEARRKAEDLVAELRKSTR